ncbi:hypothetical protein NSND_50506 [Nitrospira sp. ND1]|nr:hypothetical protein NSND_50506 [Nitrospira sp. ND1]
MRPGTLQLFAGCSERLSGKAAGSTATEAYPCGTSQGDVRPGTPPAVFIDSMRGRAYA